MYQYLHGCIPNQPAPSRPVHQLFHNNGGKNFKLHAWAALLWTLENAFSDYYRKAQGATANMSLEQWFVPIPCLSNIPTVFYRSMPIALHFAQLKEAQVYR